VKGRWPWTVTAVLYSCHRILAPLPILAENGHRMAEFGQGNQGRISVLPDE
jgi:hypothetical protein